MQAVMRFKPNDVHFKMMGREIWNKLPMLAQDLLKPYLSAVPHDRNFKRIESHYLNAFCSLQGITPEYIRGPVFKSSKVDIRRLFIASMVHIYCPHVYFQHASEINLSKRGFVMWLSKALDQQESNVSVLIREVVAWEESAKKGSHYWDFKERVESIVEKLKNIA